MATAQNVLDDAKVRTTRLDGDLLRKLKEAANRSLRSVNAEINFRLRASFEAEPQGPGRAA
jgi:hypothetical protein